MVNEKSIKALIKHDIKKLILKNKQKHLLNTVDEIVNNLSIEELKTKGIINKIYGSIQNKNVIIGGMPKRSREEDDDDDEVDQEVDVEQEQEKKQKTEDIPIEKIYAPGPPDKIKDVSNKQPKIIIKDENLQKK